MRILFYLGWVCLVAAFASAATEPFLVQLGRGGLITSAYDLWYAMAPGSLVITEIRMERNLPTLWDPFLLSLLQLPAWLLTGVPGIALVWRCHPNRVMSPEVREEYERQRESLFVIDELSSQARMDENYDPHEDDRAPSHLMFNLHKDDDQEMRDSVYSEDVPAGYPGLDYADDYMEDVKRDRQATEELREQLADLDNADQVRIVGGLAFSGSETRHEPGHTSDAENDDASPINQTEDGPDKPQP